VMVGLIVAYRQKRLGAARLTEVAVVAALALLAILLLS